jgi:hypothetical protein
MKKALCFTAAFLLMAGLASAQGPNGKKPRPLTDRALDAITAGSASTENTPKESADRSGGVLVAGSSEATITVKGALSVGDTAQQDSRALNLVNASDSAVANAANVWDGRLPDATTAAATPPGTGTGTSTTTGLTDVNVDAETVRTTTLNIEQSNQVLQSAAHSASVKSYVRTEANVDETSNTTREIIDGKSKVDTVTEVLGQKLQGGQGFAGAASGDLELTGGSITIDNEIDARVEAKAGFSIGDGLLKLEGEANAEFHTEQHINWVLPDLKLHVEGVVCAVAMGSCEASGTFRSTSEVTRSVRGPVVIRDAEAEYIVVDGSSLEVTKDYSVALTGSAMQNARALNLVNAAGSSVTNAVNVSRSPTAGPTLNLNQVNVVHQYR